MLVDNWIAEYGETQDRLDRIIEKQVEIIIINDSCCRTNVQQLELLSVGTRYNCEDSGFVYLISASSLSALFNNEPLENILFDDRWNKITRLIPLDRNEYHKHRFIFELV